MSVNEFSTTIQLSHLLASELGLHGDQAIVIDTIYNTKEKVKDDNICDIIESLFHINIDAGRVTQTINYLIKENKIYRSGNILLLMPEMLEVINSVIDHNLQCEKEALNEWLTQYQELSNKSLSTPDVDKFNECLLSFIRTFFLLHGADCYKLINGEKQSDYFDLKTIAADCTNSIDEPIFEQFNTFLTSIFSRELSTAQLSFLMIQLKKAINYLSNVIDDKTKDSLYSQMNDLILYLDTTMLYRLLNLQGEKRYESTKKLIDFCKEARVKFKVLQTTVDEMKRRIQYDARVIIEHPTPVSFASIGYKCRTSENYISTFWNEQRKSGISATDFNFRYSDIKLLLDELEIVIDETNYILDYDLSQTKNDLCGKVSKFGNSDPDYQKSPNAIEHDAECIASVCYLQKKNTLTAIESKTVFLTTDWSLIRLQRYDFDYSDRVDFAVLPSQLMQILCITSPTTSYFEAFMGLFSSSHSYFGASTLNNKQVQEIMGRVAFYKGSTPAFAERVLTSQLIQKTFSEKETEEEQNALVDEAILAEVEVMEATIAQNKEELSSKTKVIEKVESENSDKASQIDNLNERLTALEEIKNKSEETISVYEQHFEKTTKRKSKLKALLRLASGFLLTTIGVIMVLICVFALIPPLAKIVIPLIDWLKSSSAFNGETGISIAIIAILVALGVAAIPCGIAIIKPGYKELKKKYSEQEYANLPSAQA